MSEPLDRWAAQLARLRAHGEAIAADPDRVAEREVQAQAERQRADKVAREEQERLAGERLEALRAASLSLRDKAVSIEVALQSPQGPNMPDLVACWRWPGVVVVRIKHSAELVAQSLPGQPELLAIAAMAEAPCRFHGRRLGGFTLEESQVALRAAASRLHERQRLPSASFLLTLNGRDIEAQAVWSWPGVVRVRDKKRPDQLIGQSVFGQPFELDTDASKN